MSTIAFLVDQLYEDSEFRFPYDRLREEGHRVEILGLEEGREIAGKRRVDCVRIEKAIADVTIEDYDALVIPGGYSPDHLRADRDAVELTRDMVLANKPVAAVCHAPWMLIEAGVVGDRLVTSWPSIRTDLLNAGARWLDREVVVDGNIITSRKPADLEAFTDAILHQLENGVPERAEPVLETELPETHAPSP